MMQQGVAVQSSADIRYVDLEREVEACYPLMKQLRPHLASGQEFIVCWRRQKSAGYRLIAVWDQARPVALAGFRVQVNLVHGTHFYVDDLVTEEAQRSGGYGRTLMERLKAEGMALGCAKLVLDASLVNTLGHRFYYRQGLLATALRFTLPLV